MPLRRVLVLGGTALAGFTATLDNTVVAVALRDVQADLDAGVSGLQGVVTAYTVALAATLLTGGALADVVGRVRTLVLGCVAFAATSAGCATAGSTAALVGWRGAQGLAAALVLPASLAVLAAAWPEGRGRARAVAVWAATCSAALVLGPLVGGALVAGYGWRSVFWVNVPLCAAVMAVVLATATRGQARTHPRPGLDLPGQLLAATGLGLVTYAVVVAGRDGLGPAVLPGVLGVGAFAALVQVERRAAHPLLPAAVVADRAVRGAALATLGSALGVFVLLVFVSLHLQLVTGLEALPTAVRLLPLTAGLVVAAVPAGRWAHRRGPRGPVVTGLLLGATGLALTAAVLGPDLHEVRLALVLGLCGVGLGLTGAPGVTAALDTVEVARAGLAASLVNVARELGGVVAVAGLGALVVARLTDDLTGRLLAQQVAPAPARRVVDAVLEGRTSTDEVIAVADGEVPLEAVLLLRTAASESFTTSTRAALLVGAAALVLSAPWVRRWLPGSRRPPG